MTEVGGALYWAGSLMAFGLSFGELMYVIQNRHIKDTADIIGSILGVIFKPFLSWFAVGYFIARKALYICDELKWHGDRNLKSRTK